MIVYMYNTINSIQESIRWVQSNLVPGKQSCSAWTGIKMKVLSTTG